MNIDTYENTNIDIDSNSNFNPVLADIENSTESANKKASRLLSRQKYDTRQKLDLINEQKSLDRQLNSFSDHWDI